MKKSKIALTLMAAMTLLAGCGETSNLSSYSNNGFIDNSSVASSAAAESAAASSEAASSSSSSKASSTSVNKVVWSEEIDELMKEDLNGYVLPYYEITEKINQLEVYDMDGVVYIETGDFDDGVLDDLKEEYYEEFNTAYNGYYQYVYSMYGMSVNILCGFHRLEDGGLIYIQGQETEDDDGDPLLQLALVYYPSEGDWDDDTKAVFDEHFGGLQIPYFNTGAYGVEYDEDSETIDFVTYYSQDDSTDYFMPYFEQAGFTCTKTLSENTYTGDGVYFFTGTKIDENGNKWTVDWEPVFYGYGFMYLQYDPYDARMYADGNQYPSTTAREWPSDIQTLINTNCNGYSFPCYDIGNMTGSYNSVTGTVEVRGDDTTIRYSKMASLYSDAGWNAGYSNSSQLMMAVTMDTTDNAIYVAEGGVATADGSSYSYMDLNYYESKGAWDSDTTALFKENVSDFELPYFNFANYEASLLDNNGAKYIEFETTAYCSEMFDNMYSVFKANGGRSVLRSTYTDSNYNVYDKVTATFKVGDESYDVEAYGILGVSWVDFWID